MRIKLILISMGIILITALLAGNFSTVNKVELRKAKEINVLFSQHPYVEGIIKELSEFTKETGINVKYTIIPEGSYFTSLEERFDKNYDEPDVFMVGPYLLWDMQEGGNLENLDGYLESSSSGYELSDIFDNVLDIYQFDLDDGTATLGLPLGFEMATLAYNRRIFNEQSLEVPETYEELLATCELLASEGSGEYYPLATRGSDDWAMINTGYISMYANYIANDPATKDLSLVDAIDSPASLRMNEMWKDIIHSGASSDWGQYTWSKASADFGSGKAAMLLDMDNVAYYQNIKGESKEAGNIEWTTFPKMKKNGDFVMNMWSWGLSMNAQSPEKDASWEFIKYFTGEDFLKKAATKYKLMVPPRKSVFFSREFQSILHECSGYSDSLTESIPNSKVLLSKDEHIFDILNIWKDTVRDICISTEDVDIKSRLYELQEKIIF